MPEDERPVRVSGSAMIAFTPAGRGRWEIDRSVDVPDTRAPRDARALAAAAAETARAVAALPPRLAETALQRDAVAAAPARTLPGPPAAGSAYDGGLAVGRAHLLVSENFSVAILDKATGNEVSRVSLVDWFPSRPAAATFVFDPRALYDQYADRWIVVALAWDQPVLDGLAGSWLLLSVSRGPDPTGEWVGSAIDTFNDAATPNGWADYPCLGLDERAVYLTYNVRGTVGRLLVFAKTDLYDDGVVYRHNAAVLELARKDEAVAVQSAPCVGRHDPCASRPLPMLLGIDPHGVSHHATNNENVLAVQKGRRVDIKCIVPTAVPSPTPDPRSGSSETEDGPRSGALMDAAHPAATTIRSAKPRAAVRSERRRARSEVTDHLIRSYLWESSERSQPKQPSQNQVDRDKIIQEARHEENQYAENNGEGRTQVRDPYRHDCPLALSGFGAALCGVAVRWGSDGGVPIVV